MRFCTTCGRNFETSIDICPHDGTPLFGMAGEEENAAQDELIAEVASVLAGDESRDTVGADVFGEDVREEPDVLPDALDDVAAPEDDDLFGDLAEDSAPDALSDPFAIAAEASESVGDTSSADLFADEEVVESSESEEDFFAESAGLDEDDLFGEPSEGLSDATADSDVSQQIAAGIDGLLDEIDEEGERPLSMSSSLVEDEPAASVPESEYDDGYAAKKGSKMPLFIILLLIVGSIAGVYFFMNGSISQGVQPDANTPPVVAPTPPAVEEPVVEEEAAVEEESAAAEESGEGEVAVEEAAAVVEPAVEPVKVAEPVKAPAAAKAPAAKAPAAKAPAAKAPAAKAPAAEPEKPTVQEPTPEELLEQELKRMAP